MGRLNLENINYWVSEAKNKLNKGDRVTAVAKSSRDDSGNDFFKGEVIGKNNYFIVVNFDGKYNRCFGWHDIHNGIVKFAH